MGSQDNERRLARAQQICAARGARLTPVRRRALELVLAADQPIGAYALLAALQGQRGWPASGLDQIQPTRDPLDPAAHVVEPQPSGGIIDLHRGQIALHRAEPERNLAKTRVSIRPSRS